MLAIIVGAGMVLGGLLLLFREALGRGRLSDPHHSSRNIARPTLEPWRQGLGFLGVASNWPSLGLIVVGAILLFAGAF
ncbi:hypothetical protein OE766_02345 [Pararhizobium sp. YC-54]|nr:hypothetical protein [Pararhizobium sp. YC-54]MCV9997083.1 hypothetical protein [Pararhizobium sp. YC-54]